MLSNLRCVVCLAVCLGCGGTPTSVVETGPKVSAAQSQEAPEFGLPNEKAFGDGGIVSGQPSDAHLRQLAAAGFTTVITLRSESEPGFDAEKQTVESLGLRFVSLPIEDTTQGLTVGNAESIDRTLEQTQGRFLLHCGSGNRVGALLALRAFHVHNKSMEEALELGVQAGLTKWLPAVRTHLSGAQ